VLFIATHLIVVICRMLMNIDIKITLPLWLVAKLSSRSVV